MSAHNPAPVAHEQQLHIIPHAATSTSVLVLDGDSLDKMMRLAHSRKTAVQLQAHLRYHVPHGGYESCIYRQSAGTQCSDASVYVRQVDQLQH